MRTLVLYDILDRSMAYCARGATRKIAPEFPLPRLTCAGGKSASTTLSLLLALGRLTPISTSQNYESKEWWSIVTSPALRTSGSANLSIRCARSTPPSQVITLKLRSAARPRVPARKARKARKARRKSSESRERRRAKERKRRVTRRPARRRAMARLTWQRLRSLCRRLAVSLPQFHSS